MCERWDFGMLGDLILKTLHEEVKPAMGCTEPVAVALAVAKAKELCLEKTLSVAAIDRVMIKVSPNIFKNGLTVGIPGTDEVGLIIATALGITSGASDAGLEIFKSVCAHDIEAAHGLIRAQKIDLSLADTDQKIYVEATVIAGGHFGHVVIEKRHDAFTQMDSHRGVLLKHEETQNETALKNPLYDFSFEAIIKQVEQLPHEDLAFLLEGLTMNEAMADYGLSHTCGMAVGKTLHTQIEKGHLSDDLMNRAMILTAAASDARMSGASLPVMSSNGSGNNGLTALLPIVAYAQRNAVSDEKLAKAAAISHLVNSIIKNNIGRLSALCGCGVAAGTGAAVAITWLMDGTSAQQEGAVQNMIANTTGMICDGAKVGCALKLATSASAAIQSAMLATSDVIVPAGNGIIGNSADETIKNLGFLSKHAMDTVDQVILSVMTEHITR